MGSIFIGVFLVLAACTSISDDNKETSLRCADCPAVQVVRIIDGDTLDTLEGTLSLFKRQILGAHHHISPEHLDRYWDEFEWKYNRRKATEGEKLVMAIQATDGKRLQYR